MYLPRLSRCSVSWNYFVNFNTSISVVRLKAKNRFDCANVEYYFEAMASYGG